MGDPGQCQSCRWWNAPFDEDEPGLGICQTTMIRQPFIDKTLFQITYSQGREGNAVTGMFFGCSRFEAAE